MDYWTSWFYSSISTNFEEKNGFKFFIQDEEHFAKVEDFPPETTLNMYLRKTANLTATKNMCLEGGCGSCIVAVSFFDPITKRNTMISVNSCLVLLYSCVGWKIYTCEGLGDPVSGYHPIQTALVKFNGTQCGFCSSGMIMNMYALSESKADFTMKDVEDSFSGNICRCTGYRPILAAFKSLASDCNTKANCDIEDVPICKKLDKCERPCFETMQPHYYYNQKCRWFKAYSINEVLDIMEAFPNQEYMLVGGNTARGVYPNARSMDLYIDITSVVNLLEYSVQNNKLIVGANMTLANLIILFEKLSKEKPNFSYLQKLADHIALVANVPVRNVGTIAGNLMIKHNHHEFPSDIFLLLETVGATVTLVNIQKEESSLNLGEFLKLDMKTTVIKNVILPSLNKAYHFESYKIMPRAQNAHAMVNAGFLIQLNTDDVVTSARIVYGGINPNFTHASATEKYLIAKSLFDDNILQNIFKSLDNELTPDDVLPNPSPKYRKDLAIALFYKFVLSIAPDNKVTPFHRSGGAKQNRPISTGTQSYGTNEIDYPLTQPISKIEALAQCTGKAQYIMDIPDAPGQLYAAFVLAKAPANSIIKEINTTAALKLDGVKAYFDKNDVPGKNSFMPIGTQGRYTVEEEVFCGGVVKFYYQPIGVVVAITKELAERAADLVEVTYISGKEKPILTIRDIIAQNDTNKIFKEVSADAKSKGTNIKHVIKGKFDISWQYHFHMENQCCVTIPNEDGLDMYPSTQYLDLSQTAAAKMLNIPVNRINVTVRRLGGSFGGKISRNGIISNATALAAYKLQKPVKMFMTLETNMNVVGKRYPFSADYEIGTDENGVIQYLNGIGYTDFGNQGGNENLCNYLLDALMNSYDSTTWSVQVNSTRTDNATGTYCRGPCRVESLSFDENIMEHIAIKLNLDATTVRLNNLSSNQVKKYLNDLLEWAEVRQRQKEIIKFNQENRWIKKALAVVPLHYPVRDLGQWHSHVSIFQGDGTVAVTHGGTEMGQGINTKVAQVCAYALNIPLEMVTIKPNLSTISPNDVETRASVTSETVCYATLKACEILKERMKPIRDKMKEPVDWPKLVKDCFLADVDLYASVMYHKGMPGLNIMYHVYGSTCAEIEVDVLTGLTQVKRVDIIYDIGDSISPNIDIGQVEGGFVMGMGYWLTEEIIFDQDGKLLTNRSWNYKPPSSKDIPVDFRIKFPENNPNPYGILNSKASGEPPFCMSVVVPLAIRQALVSVRSDADPNAEKWCPMEGPSTVEYTFLNCLNNYVQYKL